MTVYTLFGQPAAPASLTTDGDHYTMGMQFSLSQNASLTGIYFFTPTGAADLPDGCCIYQITGTNTGSQVGGTVNTSPSWSAAAGSNAWAKVTYNGSVTLSSGVQYRVCILHSGGGNFYGHTSNYWSSGPGSGGLTSGIISAPAASGADGSNQDAFITPVTVLTYPNSAFNAANYWLDVEVTTAAAAAAGGLLMAGPP